MDSESRGYSVIYIITKRGLTQDYIKLSQYDQIRPIDFKVYLDILVQSDCARQIPLYWRFPEVQSSANRLNVIVSTYLVDHRKDCITPKSRSDCITCDQSDHSTTFEFWCDNITAADLHQTVYHTPVERLLEPAIDHTFDWVNFYPPHYQNSR